MTDREIMQQALEALEGIQWPGSPSFVKAAITALRERLAQSEQEPCGWQFYAAGKWHNGMEANDHRVNTEAAGIPTRNVYPRPVAQPEQEPIKESSVTHSHLWIGELWRKEKNT